MRQERLVEELNERLLFLLNLQDNLYLTRSTAQNLHRLDELLAEMKGWAPVYQSWRGTPILSLPTDTISTFLQRSIGFTVAWEECPTLQEKESSKPEPKLCPEMPKPGLECGFGPAEKVTVTWVCSPSLFYVRKVADERQLLELHRLLQSLWQERLAGTEVGQLVVHRGERGRIQRLEEDGGVEVLLLDSGRVVMSSLEQLKQLPPEAAALPPLAIPCSLRYRPLCVLYYSILHPQQI